MRFKISDDAKQEKPVKLSIGVDGDGEAELRANGVAVLWLWSDGTITLNGGQPKELAQLGFNVSTTTNAVCIVQK